MIFKTEQNLGASGDACVIHNGQKYYVPYLLPHEEFSADFNSDIDTETQKHPFNNIQITTPSPLRINAVCSHFTKCGGCNFQHFSPDFYRDYKINHFINSFKYMGYDNPIDGVFFCDAQTRRRTTISLYRSAEKFVWGYKMTASKMIIQPNMCHIVTPELNDYIQLLCPIMEYYIPRDVQVKIHITHADNGFDCVVHGAKKLSTKDLEHFLSKIQKHAPQTIRMIWDYNKNSDTIYHTDTPYVWFQNYKVNLAPEMFLQPSIEGQNALWNIIEPHIQKISKKKGKKTRIADLFTGAGTFSLPMISYGQVDGFDNAGGALSSLRHAVKEYGLTDKLNPIARDLFRDPVSKLELGVYDIVVADPPRQGMMANAQILGNSTVKNIIMIFCDIQTALRDIKILCDAGYKISHLYMIDQFTFTPHTEGVVVLHK